MPAPRHRPDRAPLPAGCCVAAPLPAFPVVSFGQALTRPGFDLRRHSLSSLTLGDLGWQQTINFVLTGLLAVTCAVELRLALRPGRAFLAPSRQMTKHGRHDTVRRLRRRPAQQGH
ncbi:MAG TPA: DUF998 domain-containing protein [Micromonosporaceae bacterium]